MVHPDAQRYVELLGGDYVDEQVAAAVDLLKDLRNARDHESVVLLAEAVCRVAPQLPAPRRFYAQSLIERGAASVALVMLEALVEGLDVRHPEAIEAQGLIGRAHKQMYFDARVRGTDAAKLALRRSIEAYRTAYDADRERTWHGVNLLALLVHCRSVGIDAPPASRPRELAAELFATLDRRPEDQRDEWYLATRAEASLALDDWGVIESSLVKYTQHPGVGAFHLESTRRQLTDVWRIHEQPRGRAVIDVLTAALMTKSSAAVLLPANQINAPQPSLAHYEAILGPNKGMQTKRWWETALKRANSIAAIRRKNAERFGTGFLVKPADFGLAPDAGSLLLTNCHVVNDSGAHGALRPEDVDVVFEAVDPQRAHGVREILWSSPPGECDATLLVLEPTVAGIEPLAIARALPALESRPPQPQVYVIGYPGGRELTFSFQDNEIIDHEGPEDGNPVYPDLRLIHYRANTEPGNSGSPVFNSAWDVIALHHKGGAIGMPRLNHKPGTYGANEGVWLQSIITRALAARAEK